MKKPYTIIGNSILLCAMLLTMSSCEPNNQIASQKPHGSVTIQYQHDVVKALDRAIKETKNSFDLERKFKLTITRDEDEKVWVFWFVFIPVRIGDDISVFAFDDGRVEVMEGY